MRIRVSAIFVTLLLSIALLTVTVALAQDGDDAVLTAQEAAKAAAEAEEAKARAAESEALLPETAPNDDYAPLAVITAPLFVGVDDTTVSTYLIDPTTGSSYPQFTGFQVWGAAFDNDNERILFNNGVTLYEWPIAGGTPNTLGSIVSSDTAALLSFVAFAHHEGTLYGTRNIGGGGDPEGLYAIDPVSLEATLITTYTLGASAADLGGLAAHPQSGILYATNDAPALRGVVQLDQNGDITLIAPYPAGETDIDGLAVGTDDRAYLVTDEPGNIYVFDFNTMTYTAPISNPWTTSEVFAGAAWITGPSVALTKTVGTTPGVCGVSSDIYVAAGTDVYYCYEMANTGNVDLSFHQVHDSELGLVVPDISFILEPGDSAAVIAPPTTIVSAITNTATYTAYNPGPVDVVTTIATATVNLIPTADIEVSPASLSNTQRPDTQVTLSLTIENEGTADLEWAIGEEPALLQSVDLPPAAPINGAPGSAQAAPFAAQAPVDGEHPTLYIPLSGAQAFGVDVLGERFLTFNTNTPMTYTEIVTGVTGDFYAGDFIAGDFSRLYAIDDNANTLMTLDTTSGAITSIDMVTPTVGHSWSGMSFDPVSGAVYVTSTSCAISALYLLDVATGALTLVGDISNGGCIIDIAISPTGQMYGVDVITDNLIQIDKASGAGTVIGSIGFDANFAQGMDFDDATGILYLAAFNNTPFRGELRVADLSTGNTALVGSLGPVLTEIDSFAIATTNTSLCEDGGDVPWASASPASGTTAPGDSSIVDVTFDSTGLSDGVYSGTLCVRSNDAQQLATRVPLTLTVESTTGVYLPVFFNPAPPSTAATAPGRQ